MSKACTTVDESFVKQARELLDSEGRSEMAKKFKILLDHYEKTSGKVICRFQSNCGKFQFKGFLCAGQYSSTKLEFFYNTKEQKN